MRALLTGIAGFSGSHIAEQILKTTDWDIVGLDCLTYAADVDNIPCSKRVSFICHDFSEPMGKWLKIIGKVDYILHCGAETHVKNSLENTEPFIKSNIVGTYQMLELVKILKPKKFIYVSTDEVFGTSLVGHKEEDTLNPSNPYSASKAAGEMLVKAYHSSFGVPAIITRTTNIYGSRQHEEKFIPMAIGKIRRGEVIEIHADKDGNIGSRQWIHASDQALALIFLLQNGKIGETYHIAGERVSNWDVVMSIQDLLQCGKFSDVLRVDAFKQYPGHDLHYALDDSKIRAMGWAPKLSFEEGLALTV
jgi:dTDP-glucose 4,6-dehydratase